MQIFKFRYIKIIKDEYSVKVKYEPKYLQIFVLILFMIGCSLVSFYVSEGVSLVMQQFMIYIFVLFFTFGLIRSYFKYPLVFTDSGLKYKNGLNSIFIDYSGVEKVSFESITVKKWKLEVILRNKIKIEVNMFAESNEERESIIIIKNKLINLGCPIKQL